MSVEYAPKGLFGVLTPQANTTVEPELAVMVPAGVAWINGRLTSAKATLHDRLVDYFDRLEGALGQFANAPVAAIAIACTGASYLAGPEREDALVARWSAVAGVPVITAAKAVLASLSAIGATRVGLVSPYDDALTDASRAYWTARGLDVVATTSAWRATDAFHPIYTLSDGAARTALARLAGEDIDAVVMLGTGMPTLGAILAAPRIGRAPVTSCMVSMTWAAVATARGDALDGPDFLAFQGGAEWAGRNRLAFPA
jgi:maleate cis-trans isomerase